MTDSGPSAVSADAGNAQAPPQRRGSLRVYLGAAPGVGKTFAMLGEGRRRAGRGTDVVVGIVETHGRRHTLDQIGDLEVLPRRVIEHRGARLEELDVAAVVARRPDVVLVDELAHTVAPGSAHEKRWQDIDEILEAGIDVISTVNIQHLESLNDVVERITGVRQRETVPDAWVRSADQIELVDMSPEALRRRMAHGNIYPPERIDAALGNYFRPGNLGALRELALLWLADRVEDQLQGYLDEHGIGAAWETRERVLVAVTGAAGNDAVIRRASRLAGRLRGELVGIHVARSDGLVGDQRGALDEHLRLVQQLGGACREVVGDDVADTLVSVARSERATQLVIGASRRSRVQESLRGSVVNRLLRRARDLDVHVISVGDGDGDGDRSRSREVSHGAGTMISSRRRAWAWALMAVGLPVLVAVLLPFRDALAISTVMLGALSLVVVVAGTGGLLPGVVGAVVAALAVNYCFVPPYGTFTVQDPENLLSLVVFVAVSATVSTLVDRVARRSAEAARARADADALGRAASLLAGSPDPVPELLADATNTVGMTCGSVLERSGHGWRVLASVGTDAPAAPDDGLARDLDDHGDAVLVLSGGTPDERDVALIEALARQLGVALEARALQREAAAAEVMSQTDALRSAILQAVSHDLRTPLASIKASVTSLLAPDIEFGPEDTGSFLHTIDDEVDRLDRVVGNLLDMSRLQTGAVRAIPQDTSLEEFVLPAVDGVDPEGRVEVRVPETLPLVRVDAPLMERAVANVVANALAVEPDSVPVLVEAAALGDEVHLRVVDRGPGIAPAQRAQVFEPFQRLGDRSTMAGVGLGLAIAHGMTEATGGHLDLEDTPSGGLTVVFRLPIASGPPPVDGTSGRSG